MRRLRDLAIGGAIGLAMLWAYLAARARRAERFDPWELDLPGTRFYVRGAGVHFIDAGDRDRPTVLLIHGLGGSTNDFRTIVEPLARTRRVLAVDLPGFGYSDRPRQWDYSLSSQAALLCELLDRLDIRRTHVVGHSLGGAVAMRLALDAPDRVERLVLLASATLPDMRAGRPLTLAAKAAGPALSGALTHRGLRRRQLATAFHDASKLTDDLLDEVDRRAAMRGNAAVLGRVAKGITSESPPDPTAISQPTLILWGESDRWLPPEQGTKLLSLIPNAEMRLIPEAGHMLVEEQPRLVYQAIDGFLSG